MNVKDQIRTLKEKLEISFEPEDRIDVMIELSYAYQFVSHKEMKRYAEKAINLSKAVGYHSGLARTYENLGNYYFNQRSRPENTIPYFKKCISVSELLGNTYRVANSYHKIGLTHQYAGDFDAAIEHFKLGLLEFEAYPPTTKTETLRNRMLGSLGEVFLQKNNFEEAHKFLKMSTFLAQANKDTELESEFIALNAQTNLKLKNFKAADTCFQRALFLFKELEDYPSLIHTLNDYQELKIKQGKLTEAEKLVEESLELSIQNNFPGLICMAHMHLGQIYVLQERYEEAILESSTALEMTEEGKGKGFKSTLLYNLHVAHEALGDSSQAYYILKQWVALSDSITQVEKAKISAEIEAKFFVKQREREIEILGSEKQQQQLQIRLLGFFIFILIGFLIISYLLFSSKKKQSKLLAIRNMELEEVKYELNQSNIKLKEYIDSNLQLENFAYMASHDLRAPLVNIIAFSERLKSNLAKNEDSMEANLLRFMHKNALSMETLINSLLDYSRVNTEKLHPALHHSDEVINEVLSEIATKIEEKQAQITYDALPNTLVLDKVKIKQIFQNLLLNAMKFCPDDRIPVIHISLREFPEHWEFSVKDNGIGIKKEFQEQVFLIFRKLHTSNVYEGSGIGLAAVKRLVEQHNGEIWVKSIEGEGSTFHFTISKSLEKQRKSPELMTA
ncbi:MAG: tetratricopeptide repeat protein [Bacteroidota bacterium]